MKKILFLLFNILPLIILSQETINMWAGKEYILPQNGKWVLCTAHGRIIAQGDKEVRIFLPDITEGTTLDANLTIANVTKKIKFWSSKPLLGLKINSNNYELKKKIKNLGATTSENNAIYIQVLEKYDFPFVIENKWKNINLYKGEKNGSLGLFSNKKETVLENNGNFICVKLENKNEVILLVNIDFDFSKIEQVILIKNIINKGI